MASVYFIGAFLLLTLSSFLRINCRVIAATPLTSAIRHYEPLYYDVESLHAEHHRVKRSSQKNIVWELSAHGKKMKIILKRDTSIFTNDLVVETSEGPVHWDISRVYVGHVLDDDTSYVHGVITKDGLFEGKITTKDDQYMIEQSKRFFKDPQKFHSVIYKAGDVKDFEQGCKSKALLQKIQSKLKPEGVDRPQSEMSVEGNFHDHKDFDEKDKYTKVYQRFKRTIVPSKTECAIYMQADHLYYQKQNSDVHAVIEQITNHVQAVNQIYASIDFDSNGSPDGINMKIKRIKVHTDPNAIGYKFDGNYGVEKFLQKFSEDNYTSYCLAYMMTHRDFNDGTLGLAWTGNLTLAGGVCEKYAIFSGSYASLNTGIVTTLNMGSDVPPIVSHVTLAHEIGHNMGSDHDPETNSSCVPGNPNGNFIMYARSTSGDKTNNNRFSPCSIAMMGPVMEKKARGTDGCFTAPTANICGNEIVETGEECDCGWDSQCTDRCCNKQSDNPAAGETPCTLKKNIAELGGINATCSPSQGSCCSADTCDLVTAAENKTCRAAGECSEASYCNGSSFECPASVNKPNQLTCSTGICSDGVCSADICPAWGLVGCQCSPTVDGDYKDVKLCQLCCKQNVTGAECKSTFEITTMPNTTLTSGKPCYNYNGYCDVFLKCRQVDPSGPLSMLRNLFSSDGLESMKAWLTTYWYVVVAGGVGFFVLMALFIRFCSVSHAKDPNRVEELNSDESDKKSKIKNIFSTKKSYSIPSVEKSSHRPLPIVRPNHTLRINNKECHKLEPQKLESGHPQYKHNHSKHDRPTVHQSWKSNEWKRKVDHEDQYISNRKPSRRPPISLRPPRLQRHNKVGQSP
ncbi:disintegrin and metalloproteinase domain-containing protein 10 isoform X2 [Lingula anatina]|uniref:ADAM10 endopeptidase n=1 Tax=Lingula anatina TaxID=7574 RepID=A0A1S3KA99_LINAN|nr:disintegrin and metalloproteinase domain-containing protein 10 isoform X1 [Lingula anatina]XP_013419427.1 disintegrin and metalloproteinase domain-containing protein 10 isoform X2 [Lingula anatina]|eukprot:XP_013419426.1 disintegrin and metalloproteinase domain-containing protein 10 isoform X1 [Lingula anatina]